MHAEEAGRTVCSDARSGLAGFEAVFRDILRRLHNACFITPIYFANTGDNERTQILKVYHCSEGIYIR